MDKEQIKKYVEIIRELRERIKLEEAKLANYIRIKLKVAIKHSQEGVHTLGSGM